MPRPFKKRVIGHSNNLFFKPAGIRMVDLQKNVINGDEYEALRLADFKGLSHEQAGVSMGVSRQTFGRIIESARKKVSDAIINGKAIEVTSEGPVEISEISYVCRSCDEKWNGKTEENDCPSCGHKVKTGRKRKHGG